MVGRAAVSVIGTIRTKTADEIVEDDRGKKAPKKIGLAPVQRQGLEYEFTVVLDLDADSHIATASKDRTGLFDGRHFVITAATGRELAAWLDSGTEPVERIDPYADWKEAIRQCTTLEDLGKLWSQMSGEQRLACAEAKDDRKEAFAQAEAA